MGTIPTKRRWIILSVIGCLFFAATLLFVNLGKHDLWNPDEPRYTEIAREMVLNHSYLVPQLNQQIYTQKPPFFFWLVAGSFKLFHRIDEWTARFPIAVAAFLCLILTCLIGKRLFDAWTGLLAALFLLTTNEFFWLACRVNLDTVMTLFILASMYTLILALTGERHKTLYFRLAFLFSGLATITKGPLGVIVPFLTLVIYLALLRDFKTLRRVPWISGGLIFLVVLILGLAPACYLGGKAYTRELLFHQTVTRYVHGLNHRKGFFFYFWSYPTSLLPWALFLPAAFLFTRKQWKDTSVRPSLLFVLVWMLANILFLSFSKSKRVLYALSILPAGCLLTGYYFSAFLRGARQFTAWFKIPSYLLGILLVFSGIALPFAPTLLHHKYPEMVVPLFPFILMAIGAILMGLIVCFLTGTNRFRGVTFGLLLTLYLAYFTGTRWIFPIFNQIRSPRALGAEIQKLVDAGYAFRTIGSGKYERFLFYTRMTHIEPLPPDPNAVSAFLKTSPKAAILLVKRHVNLYAPLFHSPLKVIWRGRVGHRIFLILQSE